MDNYKVEDRIIKLETIVIKLMPEQAEKFKKFLQYNEDFNIFLEAGIFNFKNGYRVIHRDNKGILRQINSNDILYKRKGLDRPVGDGVK